MSYKENVDVNDVTSRSIELREIMRRITTRFHVLTHRMNQDGNILPCNEPVLVYKERVRTTHVNVNQQRVVAVDDVLGIPASSLKDYYVEVTPCFDELGVQVETDSIAYTVDNAGATDYIQRVTITSPMTTTADRGIGPQKILLFPDSTHSDIYIEALSWTATTEYWDSVVMIYRMPSCICVA